MELEFVFLWAVVGLLVGGFLNVAIHQLPVWTERRWLGDMALQHGMEVNERTAFNLARSLSTCRSCGRRRQLSEVLPVLGYVLHSGRCASCGMPSGLRTPAVEVLAGLVFGYSAWFYGIGYSAVAWSCCGAALLVLAGTDAESNLLPDSITVPLVWAGIVASLTRVTPIGIADSAWGAIGGYVALRAVGHLFFLVARREGLVHGDFKVFAALGAWFGWQGLVPAILIASILALLYRGFQKLTSGLRHPGRKPFGPFLAGAGLVGLYLGPFGLRTLQ